MEDLVYKRRIWAIGAGIVNNRRPTRIDNGCHAERSCPIAIAPRRERGRVRRLTEAEWTVERGTAVRTEAAQVLQEAQSARGQTGHGLLRSTGADLVRGRL